MKSMEVEQHYGTSVLESKHDSSPPHLPLRMKDLCERTGLPRQVIHFYIQQGLVPEGQKTGRNMAYYNTSHVERIKLVRQLQHERFLPLKAIRAMLEQRDEAFSPAQLRLLSEVKERLAGTIAPKSQADVVDSEEVLTAAGLQKQDLLELAEIGLIGVQDRDGQLFVSRDDTWMLTLWGDLQRAGFTRELGFSPADLSIFENAVDVLFAQETKLLSRRVAHLQPDQVADMVQRALPLLNDFFARYHLSKARNFFATI